MDTDAIYSLEDNLLLFFTGYSRPASEILREQDMKSQQNDREMIANLHFVKELGRESKEALEHLLKLGCDTGQGYLFGKPEPAASIAKTLAEEARGVTKLGKEGARPRRIA